MHDSTPAGPVTTTMHGAHAAPPARRRNSWQRWRDSAEILAGHSLDGDESRGDRYSLDSAFDAYLRGRTAEDYVASFQS